MYVIDLQPHGFFGNGRNPTRFQCLLATPRNYEGPWQHALSLLQAMQARRLQLGEINVGSAVQACLAVTRQAV